MARVAAAHLVIHMTKSHPFQNVSSDEAEKPWCGAKARYVYFPLYYKESLPMVRRSGRFSICYKRCSAIELCMYLKLVKMVSFMLGVFCHNEHIWGKKIRLP